MEREGEAPGEAVEDRQTDRGGDPLPQGPRLIEEFFLELPVFPTGIDRGGAIFWLLSVDGLVFTCGRYDPLTSFKR